MCVPEHRGLGSGVKAEVIVPSRKPKAIPRVVEQPAKAITGPRETTRALISDVAGPALTERQVENLVNTGGDATPVPVETIEWAGTPKAQALETQLGTLKARSETVDDGDLRKILSDAETALGFAVEYKDDSFLTEAESGLSKAEARLQVVETRGRVTATVAPEPKPAVIREPIATPPVRAISTPPPAEIATPPQRPVAKSSPPDAERLAKIAKERAIRAALDGAVRQSQALSGQDFRTKVAPFRDALTKKLAVACGLTEPDDQTLRNPTKRTALFGEIKATVQAAIGEADTRRLLPYFISSPSN